MANKKTVFGTKEWAKFSANCCIGGPNDCKYCYAKKMAVRFGRATPETWKFMSVRPSDVERNYRKRQGRVMFPTSHDLIPGDPSFECCMVVLKKLLEAGNEVLVTTKPHLAAVRYICNTAKNRYRISPHCKIIVACYISATT